MVTQHPTASLENTGSAAADEPIETSPHAVVRTLRSGELFRGANEIHIDHAGQIYRLRKTKQDKLILTK
jgi:hemin uptake protein HemP